MWARRTWAAALVALPISIVAIVTLTCTVQEMLSPCVIWAGSSSASSSSAVNRPCREMTGLGETRLHAAAWGAGVQGVILFAAALGIWGAARARETVVVAAGLLMLLEMVPAVFSVWPLALLAGVGFLVVAYRMPDRDVSRAQPA